jgi:hypothetical protein
METLFYIEPKKVKHHRNRKPNGQFCNKTQSELEYYKDLCRRKDNYIKYLQSMVRGLTKQNEKINRSNSLNPYGWTSVSTL